MLRSIPFAAASLLGACVASVTLAMVLPAAASTSGASREQPAAVATYCHSGGSMLWANLAACGWAGPANTGPQLSDCPHGLVAQGNGTTPIVLSTNYQVISCANLRGPVEIKAAGVTIKDSTITTDHGDGASGSAALTNEVGSSATISHVTIDGGDTEAACIWHEGTEIDVVAVNCSGTDDGFFAWPASGSATSGDNYWITDSYFHGFTMATGNGHEDGFQTEGTSDGLLSHNTFRMTADATSAIGIWDSRRDSANITATGNLLTGGAFTVYAEDYNPGDGAPGEASPAGGFDETGIQFDGNSFSTEAGGCVGKYGAWFTRPAWPPYQGGPTDGWHRIGNTVLETGANINGANPRNDGKLCG